jgi:hypothetical protein
MPIHQAKAVDLAVVSRSLDEALSASPFATPDAREGRVKGKLDLILEVEVGSWQESQQVRKMGGKLIPQIGLDQLFDG